LLACLLAVAAGNVALYGLVQAPSPYSLWVLALLLACVMAAAWGLRNVPGGTLYWDGEGWHWSGVDTLSLSRLRCVFDGQRILLLHAQTQADKGIWLWLESPQMNAPWLALRRAVVASENEVLEPNTGLDR
jgi:hypothetical protein